MWLILPMGLLLVGIHPSYQDLVTLAPSHSSETDDSDVSATPESQKPIIRSLHIVSEIKYRYASTLVSSRVINPSNQSAEAAFSITLPESAFISEFLMDVEGKVYKAYVKEKEEAKAVYNQAVQAGQFAGHVALDARDSNQFTVSVNIEAHKKVTFNLTYEQLLSRNLGVYSNVIIINPQQIVDDMSVTVNIEEPSTIKDLEVPEIQVLSNDVFQEHFEANTLAKIEEISPNKKRVIWAPTPDQQRAQNSTGVSGQFIVKYDVDREQHPQQVLVDEGYFVHFFAPENLVKLRKHVVFVLDYSGSMAGRKLDQLKDAMKKILSDLDSNDYFSIVNFQSYVEAWSPKKIYKTGREDSRWELEHSEPENKSNISLDRDFVVEASAANIDLAESYLMNFSDLGATNIIGGLRTGLQLVDIGLEMWANENGAPQPMIVFLTDGQPNVEEYDTEKIIKKTKDLNTKQSPIYSLAFGYGADFNFLRKLSLNNLGFARNIYEAADASAQLNNFYRTVASPLLSSVTFSYLPGQVQNSSNTKNKFSTYFKGSEIVVAGKINKDAADLGVNSTIGTLRGVGANGVPTDYLIVIDVFTKPENRTFGHLEKTWAYLTIQQLLDKADSLDEGSEKNETKAKALEIALQYSFVTPLTSLVVVKPNETESAVDTEKIKPGSGMGGMYPPQAAFASGGYMMASYPSSGAPNSKYGPQFPMPAMAPQGFGGATYPSRQSVQSTPYITSSFRPQSEDNVDKSVFGDSSGPITIVPTKINLKDIKWLQPFLPNSSESNMTKVTLGAHQYNLDLNQTDISFGPCQVNGEPGECHHIQYCALNSFQDDVSSFVPYQCPITGDYLGVCCPNQVLLP